MTSVRTTCCIVGCGPAGAVLGLLLARAGVHAVVLEQHADFLRDFRGDTIHPSTAALMDELGLGDEFQSLPLRHSDIVSLVTDDGPHVVADFTRIPGRHVLGFLPQWDFLDFLTGHARRLPTFDLRMRTEAVGLVQVGDRVAGVRARTAGGDDLVVTADLVVGTDGRDSVVRAASRLPLVERGAPIDVVWFRIDREPDDPDTAFGRLAAGELLVMIDRGGHWQTGYVIPKDGEAALRAQGIDAFRDRIAALAPFAAGRLGDLTWDDVATLHVQLNRLRRWWRPGLLCIGDAAHAMSPVGGVGINLAIQDAVAAARILAGPLRRGIVSSAHLARVQLRRTLPTVLTQAVQQVVHDRVLGPLVSGRAGGGTPGAIRLLDRVPALRAVPAWGIGHGVLPEHAPVVARRGP
jgi:2-polyprenyl-6-methoxyphenol hydroxylase-like FAD-dependent oxidoreductase